MLTENNGQRKVLAIKEKFEQIAKQSSIQSVPPPRRRRSRSIGAVTIPKIFNHEKPNTLNNSLKKLKQIKELNKLQYTKQTSDKIESKNRRKSLCDRKEFDEKYAQEWKLRRIQQRSLPTPLPENEVIVRKKVPIEEINLVNPLTLKRRSKTLASKNIAQKIAFSTSIFLEHLTVDERFNQFKAAMSKHLKTIHSKRLNQDFEDCFTGTAAVNVLTKLFSLTRQEAELLGQQFMDQGKIIHHSYRHPFLDKSHRYQFVTKEPVSTRKNHLRREMIVSSQSVGYASMLCFLGSHIAKFVSAAIAEKETGLTAELIKISRTLSARIDSAFMYHSEKERKEIVQLEKRRSQMQLRHEKREQTKSLVLDQEKFCIPPAAVVLHVGVSSMFGYCGYTVQKYVREKFWVSFNEMTNMRTLEEITEKSKTLNLEIFHNYFSPKNCK